MHAYPNAVPALSNLKINLIGAEGREIPGALYGKVIGPIPGSTRGFFVRFTSMSPEIATFLRGHRGPGRLYAVS